jgi:hypothetical protein
VRATAWHNGGPPASAAGYGIKFSEADRDRYFRREWTEVVLDLGNVAATVQLSASFWRHCSELRSADIGAWLLDVGGAPWPRHSPPGIAVHPVEGNRFTARLIARRSFL